MFLEFVLIIFILETHNGWRGVYLSPATRDASRAADSYGSVFGICRWVLDAEQASRHALLRGHVARAMTFYARVRV